MATIEYIPGHDSWAAYEAVKRQQALRRQEIVERDAWEKHQEDLRIEEARVDHQREMQRREVMARHLEQRDRLKQRQRQDWDAMILQQQQARRRRRAQERAEADRSAVMAIMGAVVAAEVGNGIGAAVERVASQAKAAFVAWRDRREQERQLAYVPRPH